MCIDGCKERPNWSSTSKNPPTSPEESGFFQRVLAQIPHHFHRDVRFEFAAQAVVVREESALEHALGDPHGITDRHKVNLGLSHAFRGFKGGETSLEVRKKILII